MDVVASGEVDVHHLFPDLVVVRVQFGGFAEHVDRLGLASAIGEGASDLLEVVQGAGLIAHLDAGTRGGQTALEVFRVE